jgi:hypothetical protein
VGSFRRTPLKRLAAKLFALNASSSGAREQILSVSERMVGHCCGRLI